MAYILDANTFITAKNSYYAYDIVPSFWNSLLQEFRKDNIKSIDAVESEIMQGNDNLSAWFGNNVSGCRSANGESFILPSRKTQDVVNCYQTIATMVMTNRQYKDEQKSTFLSVADPWLVATAKTLKHIVVTLEVMPGANTTKVKIPDICHQMGLSVHEFVRHDAKIKNAYMRYRLWH